MDGSIKPSQTQPHAQKEALAPISAVTQAAWPPTVVSKTPRPGFIAVVQTTTGLPGFDISSHHDRCLTFDFDQSGHADHVCLYRPGTGLVWIGKWNQFKGLTQVWTASEGMGGFDLGMVQDRAFALDYLQTGKLDHVCFYRPGSGVLCIVGRCT